jgi:hypothetical protein
LLDNLLRNPALDRENLENIYNKLIADYGYNSMSESTPTLQQVCERLHDFVNFEQGKFSLRFDKGDYTIYATKTHRFESDKYIVNFPSVQIETRFVLVEILEQKEWKSYLVFEGKNDSYHRDIISSFLRSKYIEFPEEHVKGKPIDYKRPCAGVPGRYKVTSMGYGCFDHMHSSFKFSHMSEDYGHMPKREALENAFWQINELRPSNQKYSFELQEIISYGNPYPGNINESPRATAYFD